MYYLCIICVLSIYYLCVIYVLFMDAAIADLGIAVFVYCIKDAAIANLGMAVSYTSVKTIIVDFFSAPLGAGSCFRNIFSPKNDTFSPKMAPNGSQMAPKSEPGPHFWTPFFQTLFLEAQTGKMYQHWVPHFGAFSATFRQKVDLGLFFRCPGSMRFFGWRFGAPRAPK